MGGGGSLVVGGRWTGSVVVVGGWLGVGEWVG